MARENRERKKKEREAAKAEEKARKARLASVERHLAKKQNEKLTTGEIFRKISDAISQSFPDGEPNFHAWMDRNNITMKDVDKAFRLHSGAKSYDDYMRTMWDESADQVISDAKHELWWLDLKTKDEIVKGALTALKRDNLDVAKLIINKARADGKDYPEFKAMEKSIGDYKGRGWHIPHSPFFRYDEKKHEFIKYPNPYK
jgi:hypothetical protein